MAKRFWQQLGKAVRAQVEQEIPPELAYCEFECREVRCPEAGRAACPLLQKYQQQLQRQREYNESLAKVLQRV